jgi:hypothetical protein
VPAHDLQGDEVSSSEDELTQLRAEVAEYRAKNFANMSRINRAERVAEAAVRDKARMSARLCTYADDIVRPKNLWMALDLRLIATEMQVVLSDEEAR